NSDDWYVGSVTDENARTLELPLSFLDADRAYVAQIYRDGANAHWRTRQHAIAIERRTVRRGDKLSLRLAPGGGTAIRLRARSD
ncbi:MAG: glycoside hydrolase family 97 C-terminal domain-containing protein, partial [Steroidobacteraceae bacterium]